MKENDLYMKATGIVRRIDDLGRVVIPKEIRRTLRIREGDPLEIFTNKDGEVIFKKYSPINELSSFAQEYCDALFANSKLSCAICDKDSIIAFAGQGKKEFLGKPISKKSEDAIDKRKPVGINDASFALSEYNSSPMVSLAYPIISQGDTLGMIAFLETPSKKATQTEDALLSVASSFLSKQMEG